MKTLSKNNNIEIETKFAIDDIKKYVDKLYEIEATKKSFVFEKNIILDFFDNRLKDESKLLRIRICTCKETQKKECILTFKEKMHDSKFKKNLEFESKVENSVEIIQILKSIGFSEKIRYEKERMSFLYENSTICIDKVPFGNFIEIEGLEEDILKIAKKLDLDETKKINKSYLELAKSHDKYSF